MSSEENAFHMAVFNVLNVHSLLDLNLGLCLSHLSNFENPREAYEWLGRLSCAQKIEELGRLTVAMPCGSAFDGWREKASAVRALRNRFAHGVWSYLPLSKDAPVQLEVPPWVSRENQDRKWSMSISELELMAQDVQSCFQEFMSWRKKFKV